MVCKKCFSQNPDDALFCTSCGARFDTEKNVQEPFAPAAEPMNLQQDNIPLNDQQAYQQPSMQTPPPPYQPPMAPQPMPAPVQMAPSVPTTGQFFLWLFLGSLPIAGLIITIVFAADNNNIIRARFGRGYLFFMLYVFVLNIISTFCLLSLIGAGFGYAFGMESVVEVIEDLLDEIMLIKML